MNDKFKILVDADACPVKKIIVRIAKELNIPVIMYCDDSHILNDGYSEIIVVDIGKDSVDITLTKDTNENDIVVTQDYGLADLCIKKGAKVLNQNGLIFNEFNINFYLMSRDFSAKKRESGRKSHFNPKKRKNKNDAAFEKTFRNLCKEQLLLNN